MTYADAGRRLGISAIAARSLARRHDWPRQIPNKPGAPAQNLSTRRPLGRPPLRPGQRPPCDHLRPSPDREPRDGRPGSNQPTDHQTGTLVDQVIDREFDHIIDKMAGLLIMVGAMQQTIETQRSELMTAKAAFDAKEGEFRKIRDPVFNRRDQRTATPDRIFTEKLGTPLVVAMAPAVNRYDGTVARLGVRRRSGMSASVL